jgi:excinuclease UvrABC nuclease subunit
MLEGFIEVTPVLRAGVYALVRDGVVVYVGQGKKMIARVEAHRSNWGRKSTPAWMPMSLRGVLFDQVFVLPCRVEDLDRLEAAMIDLYKPKFNIKLKAPTPLTQQPITMRVAGIDVPLNFRPPTPRFERRI